MDYKQTTEDSMTLNQMKSLNEEEEKKNAHANTQYLTTEAQSELRMRYIII